MAAGHTVANSSMAARKPRMLKLCRDTHGDSEIVMAYPSDVYTGHGNDGFQILESFYRFQ